MEPVLDYSKPMIVGGHQGSQPTHMQAHYVAHQRSYSPPKVYVGKPQQPAENVREAAQITQPKVNHQPSVTQKQKAVKQAAVQEAPTLKTVAKNRQGTLQVNVNTNLKVLFSD